MDKTLEPEELRAKVRIEQERIVVRIQDELDRMIKLFSYARECMENELTDGMGYKKLAITDKDLKRMGELAKMCDTIVASKIRFDKAAKQMADTMTPAEEKAAVIAYIKSAEPQDRADIIHRIKDWEAKRAGASTAGKGNGP